MDLLDLNMGNMLIVLILGHLTTSILIFSYTGKKNKSKAVNMFILSKLFQSIAWIMFGLRVITPDMILKIGAHAVLFIGAALELIALQHLKNSYTKTRKKAYTGLLVACIVIFIMIIAFDFTENIRIAFASMIAAVLMTFPVYELFTDKKGSKLQKVIAAFYGAIILFLLFRVYAALTSDIDMNLSSINIFNTGMFLLLYLAMLAGSVGFILLDKEKLDLEMMRAATFDELTNILNRRTFIQRSNDVISLFVRRQEPVSCLLIDIDDFKKINDMHGHYAGDIVLRSFADTIKKLMRNYDLFGRYGGEEFAVLLPGTNEEEAIIIAERLRKTIESSSVNAVGSEIKFTISIGVATITPDKETNTDMLYRLSDDALYYAKAQGKNHVSLDCKKQNA